MFTTILDSGIMKDKLILVVGATGNLGGAIARVLLHQGKNVRVLVRSPSNYQPLVQAGAKPMFADLKVRKSLDSVCEGVETLITTANSALRGGADNPITVDTEGNRNLIDAAKAAGVKQFVFVSMSGADPNSPVPFFQAKGKTEEYLRSSGTPFTIVAPNAFMDVWIAIVIGIPAVSKGAVTIVGEGRRKHSFISAADVTEFIVRSINNPIAMNQRLVIGGPEPVTFRDAVAAFEKALGNREISVNSVAPGQPIPGLPDFMVQTLAGFEFFDSPMEMSELSKAFGVKLTSLEEFAKNFVERAAAQG
jgi:uncharacterized protein YbjT (DUF2867 family)